jgi:hypothetical protein
MCDNKKMNRKQRGVSPENPFEPRNKPPMQHLVPERILEKPGAIRNLRSLTDSRPLAGRFSEIGEKIFALGGKKALQICTGNWKEMSIMDGKNTRIKGKPLPIDVAKKEFVPADCHTHLHKQHVPPAYMTKPGVPYCGTSKTAKGVPRSSPTPLSNYVSPRANCKTATAIQMSPERENYLSGAKEARAQKFKIVQKTAQAFFKSPRKTHMPHLEIRHTRSPENYIQKSASPK